MRTSGALALLLFCAAAQRPAGAAKPTPNLVLITLDTLRADHVGAYGAPPGQTPNLDRLASGGIVFDDTESAAPLTLPSHASILTGRFPRANDDIDNGVHVDPESPTVAEILRARGFRTGAFVSAYVLDARWGLDRGFDTYDGAFAAGGRGGLRRSGDVTATAALTWIARSRSSRFFAWIHFYDAHAPYTPPPEEHVSGDAEYIARVRRLDAQVGRVLGALDALGLSDSTIVAAVADHGESLGEHGEATHGVLLYESVIHVPLIVRAPHAFRAGERLPGVTRTVDLVPTLLGLLGIERPATLDGVDLRPWVASGVAPGFVARSATDYPLRRFGWSPLRALRAGRFKVIDAPQPELYDLAADPQEQRNLGAERTATMAGFLAEIRKWSSPTTSAGPQAVEDEARRALGALGYVSASAPAVSRHPLPDPKDEIRIRRMP